MAVWIDASTDEYWGGNFEWPDVTNFVYLGGGIWEGSGLAYTLIESNTTPLMGNAEYTLPDTTVFGIRFTISFTAAEGWGGDIFISIKTTNNVVHNYSNNPLSFPDNVFTQHIITIEYSPEEGERPTHIYVSGNFGSDYGSDPRIYGIQMKVAGSTSSRVWTNYIGTLEESF